MATTLDTRTDKELMRQHQAGNTEAFAELYKRYQPRLLAVARGIVGSEAEDAVQEAMIKAYTKADQFRGDSAVTTWLHRIVVNAALDIARRREFVGEGEEQWYPPWRIDQARKRMDIRRYWRVLTPEQRACLVLVDMMGYPIAEAAEILDVPEGTLKTRCSRGRHRLAERMKGYRQQP